ncbi:50S ribosomal protein L6 [Candidatus Peregrinibacteria bacterium]|jgi:large subunit ribosomal protein L6|nr:50S ribosomal protein L6 [Candidatus Peregrinibacteria bacterium]MBT3599084.1 50S ribosomal protein L6 [Candidatus Peregrinibacteria bacterium]MBT4367681.1 50S ribosomal protein L6 [Candidatus Peregrinibacteria bacterium]MBT4585633.1 50S ribosomal protein L6 [Candidatus Peregrinibacteria bacterium]MBT6730390.1 50S ribosomal protein L6 [Candidatus Peregrinibacteria bacterium]
MSRIGKKPVAVPSGVTVVVTGSNVLVKGPKGELSIEHLPEVTVKVEEGKVTVDRINDSKDAMARHGLTRQLINNMVVGVNEGFVKKLEIIGVGYKAQPKGKLLVLNLGFSHPINFNVPEGVTVEQDPENKNIIVISGINKQMVGQVASDIRSYRPPEPYKGKGIKYVGEHIERKAGKTAGAKAA